MTETVNDLYKWDEALYIERLVKHSTLETAFTPGRTNDGKEVVETVAKQHYSYGFGWLIGSLDGDKTVSHTGWWSGYRNCILRVPSRRVTAIVLTNSSNADLTEITQEMVEIAKH